MQAVWTFLGLILASLCMILMFVLGGLTVAVIILLFIFFPFYCITVIFAVFVATNMVSEVEKFVRRKLGKTVW